MFFVLSGFLVGGQLITRVEEGRFSVVDYAIDRTTRVLPPLIAAVALTLLINSVFFGIAPNPLNALGNIVGLNGVLTPSLKNNAPLWSLAYEIWFYILAGAVSYSISRCLTFAAAISIAAGTLVFAVLEARMLLYWVVGALAVKFNTSGSRAVPLVAGLALAVLGAACSQLSMSSKSFANVTVFSPQVAQAMICCGVAIILPVLCDKAINLRLQPTKWLASRLSGFSYTVYVVHYPLNSALDVYLPRANFLSANSVAFFAVRLIVCLLGSATLFWLVERNTPRFRGLLRQWLITPQTTVIVGR